MTDINEQIIKDIISPWLEDNLYDHMISYGQALDILDDFEKDLENIKLDFYFWCKENLENSTWYDIPKLEIFRQYFGHFGLIKDNGVLGGIFVFKNKNDAVRFKLSSINLR